MKPDHIPSQELTDETLCRLAASGDRVAEERLVMRYNRLVRMCARPYFLAGGDSEDLIQEGMVGLLAAIREYDSSKAAVFRTYAEVCIKNRLFSVIKAAARDKHTPLNNSVSFETPLLAGTEIGLPTMRQAGRWKTRRRYFSAGSPSGSEWKH
ncbi:MAG: sigma-70 family RNA polymerase sigma factor [Flavonifractor plautii]